MLTRTDNWECCTNNIANFHLPHKAGSGGQVEIPQTAFCFQYSTCITLLSLSGHVGTNISHVTERARISNSIWNFRIRASLRSGVSTKSFFLFFVNFREITAFQELKRMLSVHKTTKKQIKCKQIPKKTLVSFFTALLLLPVIPCVKISHWDWELGRLCSLLLA